jgi:hypothetical protein
MVNAGSGTDANEINPNQLYDYNIGFGVKLKPKSNFVLKESEADNIRKN